MAWLALLSAVHAFPPRILSHDVLCSLGCFLNTSYTHSDKFKYIYIIFFLLFVNIFISSVINFFPPLTKFLYPAQS